MILSSEMMQAKSTLQTQKQNNALVRNRIIKLRKENERANKRIADNERKAKFISEMHHEKAYEAKLQDGYKTELSVRKEKNRYHINRFREENTKTIFENKMSQLCQNK